MYLEDYENVGKSAQLKVKFLEKSFWGFLVSSIMAGIFISLGAIFFIIVMVNFNAAGNPWAKVLGGVVFSIGLSFVFMAGADLFTGSNFTMAAGVFNKTVKLGNAIKVCAACYLGNLIGAAIFAFFFNACGFMKNEGTFNFMANLAESKTTGSFAELLCKGIVCNICVCIAVWCSIKMKNEGSKLLIAIMAVAVFVAGGFEHSVANMFYLNVALFGGTGVSFIGIVYNLAVVTLGNIIGGVVFVAVPYYIISRKSKEIKS